MTHDAIPEVAQARLTEARRTGTWSSALSTAEFTAIRSAGFEPVGQVLGTAVYHVGFTMRYNCAGAWQYGWGTSTQVSSAGWAPFAPLVRTMYEARRTALGRMIAEAKALGGDGVVGASLRVGGFPAGGLEFIAVGTAIRASGDVHPKTPFTSHLSGQEFGKLIHAGYVPTGLVLGISISTRHDDWRTLGQTRWRAGNNEVNGYTDLVNQARHDSREQLHNDMRRVGGDGVVVSEMELKIRERECPVQDGRRDHIAEANVIGTAITSFDRSGSGPRTSSLAILSLDPERRKKARDTASSIGFVPRGTYG